MGLDLVIKNGNLVTATEEVFADIGIANGKIAVLGKKLEGAARTLDAEETTSFREASTATARRATPRSIASPRSTPPSAGSTG